MTLIPFAVMAGAIQMVAPDRWMPASVFAWQRGWRWFRIALLSILIFTIHVALGFLIYLALAKVLSGVSERMIGPFTLVFLGAIGVIRVLRFSRMREVLYRSRHSRQVFWSLLSLLGPSEMVIPVLMKARLDGAAPLTVLLALWAGTAVFGFAILCVARASWNRPLALPRAFSWCHSRVAALPMTAGALIGVLLIAMRVIA